MVDIATIEVFPFVSLGNILTVSAVGVIAWRVAVYVSKQLCKQISNSVTKAVTIISYENEASELNIKYNQQITDNKINQIDKKIDAHALAFEKEANALHERDLGIEKKIDEMANKFIDHLIKKDA